MMVPNNYAVNIARQVRSNVTGAATRNEHFGLVELGMVTLNEAWERFDEIAARFPASEGWSVAITQVTCYGQEIAARGPSN